MSVNSKQKGSRIERQACKLLKGFDGRIEARRSQQFSGVRTDDTSADILTNIECIRFEIKGGYNDVSIYNSVCKEWIETARKETPAGKHWCILRKKDYQKWTIITELEGMVVETDEVKAMIEHIMTMYNFTL